MQASTFLPWMTWIALSLSASTHPDGSLFGSIRFGGKAGSPPPPGSTGSSGGIAAGVGSLPVEVFPGGGPGIPFAEDRWEFWWEFNHESYIDLRQKLLRGDDAGSFLAPPDESQKAQLLLPTLLRTLRDSDPIVRSASAFALARIGDPSVYPYLSSALLDDPVLSVRTHSVLALGLARIPKSVERLRAIVFEERLQDETRAYAMVSLGVLNSPESVAVLREVLGASHEGGVPYTLRLAAAYALGLTEDRTYAPFVRSLVIADSDDAKLRALFVLALGRVGDRAALTQLLRTLQDDHHQVRRSAAIALGLESRPEDKDVVRALERAAISDSDGTVRCLSEISLGRIAARGAPRIVETLLSHLRDSQSNQRAFVALALGIAKDPASLPHLCDLLREEGSHTMKGATAVGLALLGDSRALPILQAEWQKSADPMLRSYLAFALGSLGDQSSIPMLRSILSEEKNVELLRWSAIALGLLGDKGAVSQLVALYQRNEELLTRASAVHGVALLSGGDSIPFLSSVAESPRESAYVRAYAVYALGMICDLQAQPMPAVYARDHNYTLDLPFIPDLYSLF